jgi:hypothetical protein
MGNTQHTHISIIIYNARNVSEIRDYHELKQVVKWKLFDPYQLVVSAIYDYTVV